MATTPYPMTRPALMLMVAVLLSSPPPGDGRDRGTLAANRFSDDRP